MKKIVKLAVIRSNSEDRCPYGLDISGACQSVGKTIQSMLPAYFPKDDPQSPKLEPKEIEQRVKTNQEIFLWQAEGQSCPYAGKIMDLEGKEEKIDCKWGEEGIGFGSGSGVIGSPYFYRHFSGIGLDGLYSIPLGYYSFNDLSRSTYQNFYGVENYANTKEKGEIKK